MDKNKIIAIADILAERKHQDQLWGGAVNDDLNSVDDWVRFIHMRLNPLNENTFRTRMVKVAALALAAIEAHDRLDGQVNGN